MYILIFLFLYIDGLAFTTGQIGTLMLIASVTGIVFVITFIPFVRNLSFIIFSSLNRVNKDIKKEEEAFYIKLRVKTTYKNDDKC